MTPGMTTYRAGDEEEENAEITVGYRKKKKNNEEGQLLDEIKVLNPWMQRKERKKNP